MQHLGVNFGGIWRFELFSLSGFFFNFLLRKSGLIFKSPVATLLVTCMYAHSPTLSARYRLRRTMNVVQCLYLSTARAHGWT